MMLMGILDRYIARVVLGGTLIALLVVLALDVFFSFIGEVGDIGRGNYHALDALAYITLTIPRRIHELFPMAALLGSLMGLGMLASNSELVAMRAAGFSVRRVIASVLQVGILMLAVTTLVGEFVAPEADRQGQALREQALHDRTTFQSRHGYWIRDENRFIHIRRMDDPADLQDVFVYELDADHHLESATRIARARHQEGIWELSRVRTSRFEPASVQVSREQQAQRAQLMMPGVLDVVVLEPESMSVRELRRYIEYLASNGLEAERHQLALWLRLSAPPGGPGDAVPGSALRVWFPAQRGCRPAPAGGRDGGHRLPAAGADSQPYRPGLRHTPGGQCLCTHPAVSVRGCLGTTQSVGAAFGRER